MAPQQQLKSPKTPEPAEPPEQHEPPPPKKRRTLLLISSVFLVIVGAAGAGFYFMQPAHSDAGTEPPKPPVFVQLEPFTVNLLSDPVRMQFMQAGITLKMGEKATAELIKERLPEVRDRVLMVLSGKRGAELLSVQGKQTLAAEIADAINKVISPPPPGQAPADGGATSEASPPPASAKGAAARPKPAVEVLFTAFIVQ